MSWALDLSPSSLISPREIDNTPFTNLQKPDTLRRYSTHLYYLLAFVLHYGLEPTQTDFLCPLKPDQLELAKLLNNLLLGEEGSEQVQGAIHSLLWSLFATQNDTNTRDEFSDPVIQFFIGLCLTKDANIHEAGSITPLVSSLQYSMRLAYFWQAHTDSQDGSSFHE